MLSFVTDLHLVATLMMAGVIAFVHIVHYPLMRAVGPEAWARYHAAHVTRTSIVVVPLMLSEAMTAAALAVFAPGAITFAGLALVGLCWGSTFGLSVPVHDRLGRGFDLAEVDRLSRQNLPRTLGWFGRVPIAVLLAGAS